MHFVLRSESVAKLFFLVSCSGLLMYAVLAFYTFHTAYTNVNKLQKHQESNGLPNPYEYKFGKYKGLMKYILIWTMFNDTENKIGEGQKPFIDRDCRYVNCYLTTKKDFLNNDVTNFNAIVFDINKIKMWKKMFFPKLRSYEQKYIFYSDVSSDDVPICNINMDSYFNWTWTYKINSDIVSPFIEVKDLKGNVVAPRPVVNWNSNMTVLDEEEIKHLKQKKKAMAWIVTKCHTRNNRLLLARRLRRGFEQNGLIFDIYGCGHKNCPKGGCIKAIERDYYFYFVAEASFDEDYVTDEVLAAYHHYAVPVVLGGANYRRFLPEGSYINAESTSSDKLIALIEYIIKNPKIYYSFHRWRKNYVINLVEKFRGICQVCEFLNNKYRFEVSTVYKDFRRWWYSRPLYERCFPKSLESMSEVLSFVNITKPTHEFT